MNTKSVSRISGVLYIATVLAFLVSNLFLKEPLVDAGDVPGTLERVADNALQYQLAVALDFLAMVAVMALVFSLFTILRPHGPYLARLRWDGGSGRWFSRLGPRSPTICSSP